MRNLARELWIRATSDEACPAAPSGLFADYSDALTLLQSQLQRPIVFYCVDSQARKEWCNVYSPV